MYLCLNNEFGIRYDRFIRALMNHGRNDGFVPLPFTGCDSYNPIRIMFSISWFPFYSRSSSSFPLHAEKEEPLWQMVYIFRKKHYTSS